MERYSHGFDRVRFELRRSNVDKLNVREWAGGWGVMQESGLSKR